MSDKDYRTQLLEAAAALGAQEARQTPEDQLQRIVIQGLGLPDGTVLTDQQWDRVLSPATPPVDPQPPSGALDGLALPGGR
ncbi:MAG: hypothetical protein JWQ42_1709 [Edaphobacter sp.]|nr:hypothetical protein [Edaphobacter sp.]